MATSDYKIIFYFLNKRFILSYKVYFKILKNLAFHKESFYPHHEEVFSWGRDPSRIRTGDIMIDSHAL